MNANSQRAVHSVLAVLARALDRRSVFERTAIEWLLPAITRNLERLLAEPITPDLLAQLDHELVAVFFEHRAVLLTALDLLEEIEEEDLAPQIPAIREYLAGTGTEDLADWTLRFFVLLQANCSALAGAFPTDVTTQMGDAESESLLASPVFLAAVRTPFLALAIVESVARRAPPTRVAEIATHAFLAAQKIRELFGLLGADLNPDSESSPAEKGARVLRLAKALGHSLTPEDHARLSADRLGAWSSHDIDPPHG